MNWRLDWLFEIKLNSSWRSKDSLDTRTHIYASLLEESRDNGKILTSVEILEIH